ncbi:unnamed protein product [Moneuplotes crassus]|uniref:Uncharacterized protein n=1 Tax=Euplotes crassus TaxID=5936 RepID=A0AAD1Y7U6_EUPCR|nr:unnamed protein product [Moneuplotes crassus]
MTRNIIHVCLRIPDYALLKEYYKKGGKLCFKINRYSEAIQFYEPLRNMCKTTKDSDCVLFSLLKIGEAYQAIKKYDQAIFAFKKLLQFGWKYDNYKYEIKAYERLCMQYFFKSDSEKCFFYHNRAGEGKCEEKKSYIRYLNEANLYKKEREHYFTFGELKMHDYEEGIKRLANDINFCSILYKHSCNNFNELPKPTSSPLALSSFTEQTGVQVLLRIDTPIERIAKIEAPSPTLSKKLKDRKAKFKLLPDETAPPQRTCDQDDKFKVELTPIEKKRLYFRKYIRTVTNNSSKLKKRNNSTS